VEKITVSGLSNEAQQQLLSRLPVHVGSRLSSMKFRDYFAAIDRLDKDLEFAIVMLPDGKAELRITAPKK
jgi:outer membrane protein assembly factor BamA